MIFKARPVQLGAFHPMQLVWVDEEGLNPTPSICGITPKHLNDQLRVDIERFNEPRHPQDCPCTYHSQARELSLLRGVIADVPGGVEALRLRERELQGLTG